MTLDRSKDMRYEGLNASIALAAAFFEQTGLRELIDSKFSTDVRQKLSPGNAVKALIGDMVGTKGRSALSNIADRYMSAPVDLMFGPKVDIPALGGRAFSRNLDLLFGMDLPSLTHTVFYTTISTGIGGGVIINGKIHPGKKGFGGEVANIIIDRNREAVNYLNPGAIENEASGTALKRKLKKAMKEEIKDVPHIFEKAQEGDPEMKKMVEDFEKDLGQFFATVSCVIAPDIFVVGGGLTHSADKFLDGIIQQYQDMSHEALKDTPIVVAELKEPGIVGAAMLPKSQGF